MRVLKTRATEMRLSTTDINCSFWLTDADSIQRNDMRQERQLQPLHRYPRSLVEERE